MDVIETQTKQTESEMKTIKDYEIVDHGVEGSQYFQGCSTMFTDYNDVATGAGNNPQQAICEALDQLAEYYDVKSNHNLNCEVEDIEAEFVDTDFILDIIKEHNPEIKSYDDIDDGEEIDLYYYVSIRVK